MPTDPVVTNQQIHDSHAQNVADNLNQAGLNTTPADVKPTTSDTPIQKTQDLMQAGAKVIGEDIQHGFNDLGYIAEADLKHGDKIRTTESKNPLKMLIGKLRRKKNIDQDLVEK